MRSLVSLLALGSSLVSAGAFPRYQTLPSSSTGWPAVLGSIGLLPDDDPSSRVIVSGPGAPASPQLLERVNRGAILVLEGQSPLGQQLGFHASSTTVAVRSLIDVHSPKLSIVWEKAVTLARFAVPGDARVFTQERWSGAPMAAGVRRGEGAVFWVAASPGPQGYERFPYLLAALCDLGLEPPFASSRLWAFFDSSYRSRVDLAYFAKRWQNAGIAGLHVAAWHFFEPDAQQDAYLKTLIAECHRQGILVYAWLELPHVSDAFWEAHPEWREKTGMGQDAHLDWRRLMNLSDRNCFRAVSEGVDRLLSRFDWDGVNLAELYFESLEGLENPSRFTPMNAGIRSKFRSTAGFDPLELFGSRKDPASRRLFLDFRSKLARRMQEEWIAQLETFRARKPFLELVLTHVDDRFDSTMRDAIGADAGRLLPMLEHHDFTFLVEDPATVWNLGPQRYRTIAERYQALTTRRDRLAIDLNVVERYQDVYPTKQQTGVELLQQVHHASQSFDRVALYAEHSLLPADDALLSSAAAGRVSVKGAGSTLTVDSTHGVGLRWKGPAKVDGVEWPARTADILWLPSGLHSVEPGETEAGVRLLRLTGDLRSARAIGDHVLEFSYQSATRAFAVLNQRVHLLRLDGNAVVPNLAGPTTLTLPPGQHSVTLTTD